MITLATPGPRPLRTLAFVALLALGACADNGPPPVASAADDSFTVDWQTASPLAVKDNDTMSGGNAELRVVTPPQYGTLSQLNGVLSYTPDSGYFGADEFRYRIDVADASSTATVKLVVQAQFAMQGVVTDGPIANAKVRVTVANAGSSQTFDADADAAGRYNVLVKASQPSDFITVAATGVGTQSAVVLTSLVGEAGAVASHAADGKLTAEEVPALMVTHLSAAQAGLLAQAGPLPASNAALSEATQKLDNTAVLYAAALVRLVVDHGVALPAGVASTRDLLQSAPTLAAFQAARLAADRPQLEAAWESALTDPMLTRLPPTPAAGAAPVVLRYGHGLGGHMVAVPHITLRADGTATVVTDAARTARWRVDGTALVLTYDNPIVTSGFTNGSAPTFTQYPVEFATTSLRLSDLGPGNSRQAMASMTTLGHRVIQAGPEAGRTDSTGTQLLRRYAGTATPLRAEDFPVGARIAGLSSERRLAPQGGGARQDVLRITGAGTGIMERTGAPALWRVLDGALLVDVGTLATRYVPLGTGPLGEERWAMELLDTAGSVASHHEIMAMRADTVTMGVADWAKPWVGNLNAASGLKLATELQANGRWGNNSSTRGDPLPAVSSFARYWRQLPDGRLEMPATAGNCDPFAGVPTCRVTVQRYWTPVARVGRTVWLMEQLIGNLNDPTGPGTDIRFVAFTERLPGT